MSNTIKGYSVVSANFSWHAPVPATSYADALRIAKARGFEARIEFDGELVATWSPLYGTHPYKRELCA